MSDNLASFTVFLPYFAVGVIELILLFTVGAMLLRFVSFLNELNEPSAFFFSLFLGSVSIVFLYAVYLTRFHTILIGLLVIIPILYTPSKKGYRHKFLAIPLRQIFLLVVVYGLFFLLKYYLFFYQKGGLAIPHPDQVFYSKVSIYLNKFGNENFTLDYIYPDHHSMRPYHYFELWLTGLIGTIPELNNLYVLIFNVEAVLAVFAFFGLAGLLSMLKKHSSELAIYVVSLLALILSAHYFDFFRGIKLLDVADVFTRNLWNYPKLAVIYIFLLFSLNLMYAKPKAAIPSLLLLPIVFISTAPAILGAFVIVTITTYGSARDKRELLTRLLYLAAVVLPFIIFYFFSGIQGANSHEVVAPYHARILGWEFFTTYYAKTAFNVFAGGSITIVLVNLLLFLPLFRKTSLTLCISWLKKNELVRLLLVAIFVGLGSWALLHSMPDSVQLFANISVVAINLIAILSLWIVYETLSRKMRFTTIAVIVMICTLNFISILPEVTAIDSQALEAEKVFINEFRRELDSISPLGGFIKDKSEFVTQFDFNTSFAAGGMYLAPICEKCHTVSLSIFDIPLDSTRLNHVFEKRMIEETPLYRFGEFQKKNGEFVDQSSSVLAFISANKIGYVIASKKAVVPNFLLPYVRRIIENPKNGDKVVLLNEIQLH